MQTVEAGIRFLADSLAKMSGMKPEKKSLDNQSKIKKMGDSYILYDADIIAEPTVQLFDGDYHTKQDAQQNNSSSSAVPGIGRARVVYFSLDNKEDTKTLVLKHYYRGGAVASISKDKYLGRNVVKSRAFREWRLLKKMRELGLPVPVPVAAHMQKGWLAYRADLITEKIENSVTLADVITEKTLPAEQWQHIGACIKAFHQNYIYHADLNARNILLVPLSAPSEVSLDAVYLIDFDNSGFRVTSESWKMANLARLKRSLLKFKNNFSARFSEGDWNQLLKGYKDSR